MNRVVGIIPARYESSRFPGKPLVRILGRTMIDRVSSIAAEALGQENVYVATDDERIRAEVCARGYQCVMTGTALTGTDRTWQAAEQIDADTYVNIQGDEPMLDPRDILRVVEAKRLHPASVINGYCALGSAEDPASPNIPKVAVGDQGQLVYMSRSPIPGCKTTPTHTFHKQVCIYGFNLEQLRAFGSLGRKSRLEAIEDIEILRFLDLGIPVLMTETSGASLAVDVPEDVARVEAALLDATADLSIRETMACS